MKKFMIVGAILAVAVLALGVAGFAYAQTQTPWPGMMGGNGMMGGGRGMMGGAGMGQMHTYMIAEWAEAFGMTVEELEASLAEGQTMWTIAEAQGMTQEEFDTLMVQVRSDAIAKMVEDGVLTQEQANAMLAHMTQMHANGGMGGMMGGQGRGRGMHGGRGGMMGGGQGYGPCHGGQQAPAATEVPVN